MWTAAWTRCMGRLRQDRMPGRLETELVFIGHGYGGAEKTFERTKPTRSESWLSLRISGSSGKHPPKHQTQLLQTHRSQPFSRPCHGLGPKPPFVQKTATLRGSPLVSITPTSLGFVESPAGLCNCLCHSGWLRSLPLYTFYSADAIVG